MARVYLCVLDQASGTHSAVIDLEKLPEGADANTVVRFEKHGVGLGAWLQADSGRAASVADNIRDMKYDSDAILFITEVASLYENMPPAPQEKDLVVAVLPDQVDIFRTSPEVAEDTWRRFNRLGAQ